MKEYKYIIIGGGTTAGYTAKELVKQGLKKNELCIISAESTLPIDRPPLSKDFFTDDEMKVDDILINPQEFYDSHGIEIKLNEKAKSVDLKNKHVELEEGKKLKYEKLLLATGSKLRTLPVKGSELKNIFYLRTAEHSQRIRKAAENAEKIVVIGGQYIGTEMASSLRKLGKEVTMVFPEDRLLSKFSTADIAGFLHNYFHEKGVEMIHNKTVTGFEGDGKVEKVLLEPDGSIEADMVVAGIGVEPNIEIVEGTAIAQEDGIVVNEYLETNKPGVFAAGDVAKFPDNIFKKMRRVEHWENAYEQGTHAALILTGQRKPYSFLSFFFSDIFDLGYEYYGDSEKADTNYIRGDLAKGDFSSWWFDGDKLVAAFIMAGRPEEEGKMARKWITDQETLDREKISDTKTKLENILK